MEEHLRQLVIDAHLGEADADRVREERRGFKSAQSNADQSGEDWVRNLIRIANGAGEGVFDTGKYADIRFMTAKDAMAELRRLANGVGLDLPPRMNTDLEAPEF